MSLLTLDDRVQALPDAISPSHIEHVALFVALETFLFFYLSDPWSELTEVIGNA